MVILGIILLLIGLLTKIAIVWTLGIIALVVGLILIHLVTHLPILGGLVAFLGLAFGLGLIVQSLRQWRRQADPGYAGASLR